MAKNKTAASPTATASPVSSGNGRPKTVCPISRQEFSKQAKILDVTVGGKSLVAEVKEFSTGSLGWFVNGKLTLEVGGQRVTVQANISLVIVGSKDLPE